jgi:vancomycin resistance protein YoaR
VDAALDVRGYRRIDDAPGRELDVEATLRRLASLSKTETVLTLAFRELAPTIRSVDLPPVDVALELSSFETDFRKKAGRRALNIRRAAELLDGYLLSPGATFSFNAVVGERTEERGFTWAPVIVNDEMEPGLGGGVCQVASTLHAAAVYGNLEILERRSHSRPSGYAPLGLDAAVIYGEVDLQFRNPYPVTLMIEAFFPSPYVIRIELRGMRPEATVDHKYAVLEKHDFMRRIVQTPALAAGEFERVQKGNYGYDVLSTIKAQLPDGTETARRYHSTYYPVPEVLHVGPGTLAQALPDLPEGAVGVEGAELATSAEVTEPN